MGRNALFVLVFLAVVAGLVVWAMQGIGETTCEVCITYNGETACRTGVGRSESDAVKAATTSACAVLASGMTERMRCEATPPSTRSCP